MGRRLPTPWQRADRNGDWYLTLSRKQNFIAPAGTPIKEVKRLAALALAKHRAPAKEERTTFRVLAELLLDEEAKPKTFQARKHFLSSFAAFLEARGEGDIHADELRPFYINEWWKSHPTWSAGTRRLALSVVNKTLNWAVKQTRIEANPLAGKMDIPPVVSRGERSRLSAEVVNHLLDACLHQSHKDLLIVMVQSGVRPGEACSLTAADLDIDRGLMWVTGKRGRRAVALSPQLVQVLSKAAKERPTGPLLVNARGIKWKVATIVVLMKTLRERLKSRGIEVPREVVPYAMRHTAASNLLASGIPGDIVAAQMGHSPTMLHKHYSHLNVSDVIPHMSNVKPTGPQSDAPVSAGVDPLADIMAKLSPDEAKRLRAMLEGKAGQTNQT